jgi:hypothetical protein
MSRHRAPTRTRAIAVTITLLAVAAIGAAPLLSPTSTPATAAVDDSPAEQLRLAELQRDNCRTLAANSSGTQRTRAQQCVADQTRIIALLTGPTPTATATVTPTRTPVVTTTPPPTTTTRPPATTTAPATTPPATTPASGWPDASNTGVPSGVTLTTYTGPSTITTDGTTITGKALGCVTVQARNVVIRDSRIRCSGMYPLRVQDPYSVTVVDSEIDGMNSDNDCVAFDGYTLLRVDVHGCADGAKAGNRVRIEDSWIHALSTCSGCHNDTIQSEDGNGIVIRHNRLENAASQTGVIKLGTALGPLRNVLVERNLLNGGGYTVYAGGSDGTVENLRFIGNRFGQQFYPSCGYWGPVAYWHPSNPGSVWTDNRYTTGGVING